MPGSAWIDALVEEANNQANEDDHGDTIMTVENIREEDAHKIVTTYKHKGADVRITKNRDATVNLSIEASGGSSIQDVVTGPNGLVHMNVDGVSITTTGTDAMTQLRKRGAYRVAPDRSAPLAHAAMRKSTSLRKWKHYLKRYVRNNRWTFLSALLITPILKFMSHEAFTLPWFAKYIVSLLIMIPVIVGVGALELRQAMRKRAKRLVRHGWKVPGIPEVIPFSVTSAAGVTLSNLASTTTVEDLCRLMGEQRWDDGRLAVLENPSAVPAITVLDAVLILKTFQWDDGRSKALSMIRSKICDPKNGHLIARAFTYDDRKKEAVRLASDPWNGNHLS